MNEDDKTIDTRGYSCPVPLIMISRKIKYLTDGDTVTIIFDDKSFKRELEIWCGDTGNDIIDYRDEGPGGIAIIRKGSGYRTRGLRDRITFVMLGVKLHLIKFVVRTLRLKKIQYLITFISIAEGVKSDSWLESRRVKKYTMLPVPPDITRHCGLVLGVQERQSAEHIFNLLSENGFGVEDIYYVNGDTSVPVKNIR